MEITITLKMLFSLEQTGMCLLRREDSNHRAASNTTGPPMLRGERDRLSKQPFRTIHCIL